MNDKLKAKLQELITALNQVLLGKPQQIELAVACILARGHLLIEDLPGMGKTTLSHALADVFGLDYQRVQFTSDMLPADLIGISVFERDKNSFTFHPGPIFNQLILADEINRANPKTQSALLEAMEEQQVSVDGETHPLPSPFFVIATQNPVHQSGTYPLPESQLDRFLMRLQLGFPPQDAEKKLLKSAAKGNQQRHQQLFCYISPDELLQLQQMVDQVLVSDNVVNYVMALLEQSRQPGLFPNQLSPRAGLALIKAAQALAYVQGKTYVSPDQIQAVLEPVTEHRLRAGHSGGLSTHYAEQLLKAVDPLA